MADLDHIYGREAIENARRVLEAPGRVSGATVMDFVRAKRQEPKVVLQYEVISKAVPEVEGVCHGSVPVGDGVVTPSHTVTKQSGVQHFCVMVDWSPLPSKLELQEKYFFRVSNLFDGRPWKYQKSGCGIGAGVRTFRRMNFDEEMTSDKVTEWAVHNDYRCANHIEAVAFSRAFPTVQFSCGVVALGSSALWLLGGKKERCVAVLESWAGQRTLVHEPKSGQWNKLAEFLLVRR